MLLSLWRRWSRCTDNGAGHAFLLDVLRETPTRAVISPDFVLNRRYGFRIGGLPALEFLNQAVLELDLSNMRLVVRTTGIG